jgi:sterol carrier protein 2
MVPLTFVAGVGMTPFRSPKKSASQSANPGSDYFDLAVETAVKALLDAGLIYDDVDQGIASYVFGDSTCGQRVFYALGMTYITHFQCAQLLQRGKYWALACKPSNQIGASRLRPSRWLR